MSVLWSAAEAARATGGTAIGDWQVSGVSIDTRSMQAGDLFVALTDVRDGHDFVAQALSAHAGAALVSRIPDGVAEDAPLLIVPDVLEALEKLGVAGRARSRAQVVAVTGSVGKTSTKDMLRDVLARQGVVHAAEMSFNNQWGVPITLARLPKDADFAVIEIGMNHPGEIAPLAAMARPDVALITNVAAVHLEAFDSIAGIAREKASVFSGLAEGGVAIINTDPAVWDILSQGAGNAARIVTFGSAATADFRLLDATLSNDTTIVTAQHGADQFLFKIMTAGRHFGENALGVLAVVDALGCDPAIGAVDLGLWQPPSGRGTRETIVLDIVDDHLAFDLLDDAFNANPTSIIAALEVLAAATPKGGIGSIDKGRRIAVLGDMLELGDQAGAMHRAIGELATIGAVDVVHCVGPLMAELYDILPPEQRGQWCETAPEMAAQAHVLVDAGDIVLVKGSKGSKVSLVVDALRKLGHRRENNKLRGTE